MVGWYKMRASTSTFLTTTTYLLRNNSSAVACNLINNDMKQFIISSETDAIREVEERVSGNILLTCFYLYVNWKGIIFKSFIR